MKIGTQTKKNMLSLKIIILDLSAKFQDGRRRKFGNSSPCNKVGNYYPILMQIGTQTKKSLPKSDITKPDALAKFRDDRRRHFVN
jgi:hypothetical protein